MRYQILNQDADLSLIQRLLKVRNVSDAPQDFLNPSIANYRLDPFLLNDMEKGVDRIIDAMKRKEKIMIFGDYDVDGITSSFSVYKFISYFLGYKNISIRYPNRVEDGYGLKNKHLDAMKNEGVQLIITVDNGIASVEEAKYAKELGIDMVVTDHHHALETLPDVCALINPQVSPLYPFKGLAGVGVAFKLINALLSKSTFSKEKKNQIFNYFLPIVAIGTVADVVPLVQENRVIVKRGLELMNYHPDLLPKGLQGFLNFLNLKGKIDTFHIGFVIGPRINAGGRIESPYDSLRIFLSEGEHQLPYLERIESINTERRRMQDQAFRVAEKQVNPDQNFLFVCDESFHEGIVGIVSGRITEKYYKPSAVFKLDLEKKQAVASLRGPDYFNVIEMIIQASPYLKRFGGHKGAGGLTVDLEHLDTVLGIFQNYCQSRITSEQLEKVIQVDTCLLSHEWNTEELSEIEQLAPFGEGNQEPNFLLEGIKVEKVEKVGKNGGSHLKIYGKFGEQPISSLFSSKGVEIDSIGSQVSIVGAVKRDSYNGGFYVYGNSLI
ncbi:single-stranded-DNA-specific exonuclease RecJ [SR1 bacterium human oral taxon HOT-345]|nr:single-stranded-DNA-specific exonuclease RecJ [SR1 bacterium human oral taxon HOT-345]